MAPETIPYVPQDDAQRAFLFHCAGDEDLHAISLDPSARNIKTRQCLTGWVAEGEIILGVHEVLPLALNPEPVRTSTSPTGSPSAAALVVTCSTPALTG